MKKTLLKLYVQIMRPENRNKLLLVLVMLFICTVFVLWQIDWKNMVPDLRNYRLRSMEYMNLQQELNDARQNLALAEANSVQYGDVWVFTASEDPRLAVMQRLESIAAECGIKLRTAGNLKDVQIADGVIGYELDVNADAAPLANVCKFSIAMSVGQPKFFWDNLTIKPAGGNVTLSGKLKVVVVTGKNALQAYWGGVKPNA